MVLTVLRPMVFSGSECQPLSLAPRQPLKNLCYPTALPHCSFNRLALVLWFNSKSCTILLDYGSRGFNKFFDVSVLSVLNSYKGGPEGAHCATEMGPNC